MSVFRIDTMALKPMLLHVRSQEGFVAFAAWVVDVPHMVGEPVGTEK